ncbi:hypothetical protein IAU60_000227 [Kwoniella sp. DSM 27419]
MSAVASSSRPALAQPQSRILRGRNMRYREPLMAISIAPPHPYLPPSPVSLPSKRGPSTFDSAPSSPGGKARKVSRTKKDGSETVRKTRLAVSSTDRKGKGKEVPVSHSDNRAQSPVTPRVRSVLERDDLGTGKSPARRLFPASLSQQGSPISGVSGAIASPSSAATVRRLDTSSHVLDRSTAPTSASASDPTIPNSQESSPFLTTAEEHVQARNEITLVLDLDADVHECGFTVLPDDETEASQTINGLRTPRSRRRTPQPALEQPVVVSQPASPALDTVSEFDNQENIVPLALAVPPSPSKTKSLSAKSTPSKYSSSTDDEIVSLYLSAPYTLTPSSTSGSGTRRRERSKLVNEVMLLRGEVAVERETIGDEEGAELTPGRKVSQRGEGKKQLAEEVDLP